MDHDVMHRDIQKLKAFSTRVEGAIAFVEYMQKVGLDPVALVALAKAQGQASQPGGNSMSDADRELLKATLDGFSDRLGKLEISFSESGVTTDLSGRVAKLEAAAAPDSALADRVSALESAKLPQDLVDRMTAALTWFDDNVDGLEILLGLDGDPDAPDAPPATPPAGPTDGQGAPAAGSGTDGPATGNQASPSA